MFYCTTKIAPEEKNMIRAGIIGLGKMGISHYALVNTHPDVTLVAVCDASSFVLSALEKQTQAQKFYTDYRTMIDECALDCVVVCTPTSSHAEIVRYAMERKVHVFVEKPFCFSLEDGRAMTDLAQRSGLVNQVGYHNRFVASFAETRRLVRAGAIGDAYHFAAEAYGPVVVRPPGTTWRFKKSEGGGCLYDYASHAIDLVNFIVGPPDGVAGTVLQKVFSREVEDAVFATLTYNDGRSGQLSVNWSDGTYRKMTTRITVWGTKGKIAADRQECAVYLTAKEGWGDLCNGWTIRYTTDLTPPVAFYLRGEEYTAQMYHFIECIAQKSRETLSSFASALRTDLVIDMLAKDAEGRSVSHG
jgi:predicted dehydrogenase